MPRRNTVKTYISDGIYHIYNRGVDKRKIFLDDQDYKIFLHILKETLSPPQDPKMTSVQFTLKGSTFKGIPKPPKNYNSKIQLLAYCLMPNHFHLLIKQKDELNIKEFMHSISTRYSMYFNKKNNRIGSLFQGIYKAVLVSEDPYLLHLSRYIHCNPLKLGQNLNYTYSSYLDYLNKRNTLWIDKKIILSYFDNNKANILNIPSHIKSYQSFVEDSKIESEEMLESIILDDLD